MERGLGELIEAFGVITFCLLWATALLGFGLWKLHLRFIRPWYHYLLAAVTLVFATIHMMIVTLSD